MTLKRNAVLRNAITEVDNLNITTSVGRYINYTYDAGGTLLKKQLFDNNVAGKSTDYIDGLIMPGSNIATPTSANKNLYNEGSEWQNDFGDLPDYYNTFFRNYDAALGRFIRIDPKAEASESFSTYQYANNNPLIFNDPLGDIAISQKTLNFLEFIRSEGGKFGGVYSVSSNSDGLILGTMTYFTSHQDSMGEMDNYLSKNGYWGFTTAKNFKTAWDNLSTRIAAESNGAELGLREVTISAAKTNNNWLVDRQKEALAKAGLDGHTFYGAAVFFNKRMAKGNAVTLPGIGIFINPSDVNDVDLLRHEFGHVLQSRISGNSAFYLLYGLPSVISGLRQKSNSSYDHHLFWTEIDANVLSKEALKIERWNTDRFPLEVPIIEPIKIAPNDVYNTLFP